MKKPLSTKELNKEVFAQSIFFLIFLAAVIFIPSLNWTFWPGWLYLACFAVGIFTIDIYLIKNDPELLKRRMKIGEGGEQEKSQKVIQTFNGIMAILLLLIPAMDIYFHWSNIPNYLILLADCLFLIGFLSILLVFRANTYTSSIIEVDKGQTVISTGPYAYVRHPMYSFALIAIFCTPIALNSWYGLIPAFGMLIGIIIRILDEEKFLQKNLHGYKEYSHQVRSRLIPFIW